MEKRLCEGEAEAGGTQRIASSHPSLAERHGGGSSSEPAEGTSLANTTILSHPLCHDLLWRPEGTKAPCFSKEVHVVFVLNLQPPEL